MEDALKRLLAAEKQARDITSAARREADAIVQAAMNQAKLEEGRFKARVPELRAAFVDKAEQRAAQAIKELERRFDEHIAALRAAAEVNEDAALDAAFDYLIYPDRKRHT